MNGTAIRLQATVESSGQVAFAAQFTAPDEEAAAEAFVAELATGDGVSYALGPISPPTAVTWREQRSLPLTAHTYKGAGPFTAELRLDGLVAAAALVRPTRRTARASSRAAQDEGPALFAVAPVADEPGQRTLRLHARALPPGQRLRVDGGAGQVRELAGEAGQEIVADMLLSYAKPGMYLVSVELLDGDGFWLETLAQTPLEISAPAESGTEEAQPTVEPRAVDLAAAIPAEPWLPYRNFKARAGGTRTYSRPGGGTVRRSVGTGVWLTARHQTQVGGATWYQTAGGDWVKADSVTFFDPSDLHGVRLDASAPPPPPPPPPPPVGQRKGVVTADRLNVRARPGTAANNPPIDVLRAGAQVTIFEEQMGGGEVWYRIGTGRWVVAQWVRVAAVRTDTDAGVRMAGAAGLPFGWVVPEVLDVRASPGVNADNPVIAQLKHYDVRPVLGETTASGSKWLQVGQGQWVEARQLGVARLRPRPSSIGNRRAVGGSQPVAADGSVLRGRPARVRSTDREWGGRHADGPGHLPNLAAAGDGQDVGAGLLHRRRDLDVLLLWRLCAAHRVLAR